MRSILPYAFGARASRREEAGTAVTDAHRRKDLNGGAPFPLDRRTLVFRFRRNLKSTKPGINRAVRDILKNARITGCLVDHQTELEIALREALANAVLHGNRSNADKKVLVRAYCDPRRGFVIAVRDEGPGFDPETNAVTGLFHPRRQRWEDHFERRGIYVIGKTALGRTTVQVLNMNSEDQLTLRSS